MDHAADSPSLVDRVTGGDVRAIARAISVVESGGTAAADLVARLHPRTGRARLVGVTGPPGAGKSTLVAQLVGAYRRAGSRVAVLAVDPSSPFSGGAILGDRIRMQGYANDPQVFIRSMATRGHLGGLAAATADAATVLDAAGFDVVLIETVGVGQDEVDVSRVADISVLVTVPGAGDDVQAMKAGVMETADVFAVNKADQEGADRAVEAIAQMQGLDERAGRPRPVVRTIATSGQGIDDLIAAIEEAAGDPGAVERRGERLARRLYGTVARLSEAGVVDHVGVAVDAAGASLTFFRDLFDLAVGGPEDVPSSGVRVRFVETGDTRVELIEATDDASPFAASQRTRGPGLHHLALRVTDLDAALARLSAAGVRLIDQAARSGAHGTRVAFVHPSSAGGVLVELVERSKEPRAHR